MAQLKRFSLVSLMALGFAMPALAQTPPPSAAGPQAAPQGGSDVIIITANKREESVQDVAVAVTAITSEKRDEIGLQTMQDYTNFAPGLTYSTASDRIGMRGISRNSNNFGVPLGISNYVDGIYQSSSVPGSREPIFIDRVEVVRGPQGTLYGKDAIGGALNIISKRPTSTFQSQVDVGVGNYDTKKIEGTVSGPITDWLRYRISGTRNSTDEGYFTNYADGSTEGGRNDGYYLEGQLAGNIGEKFDWWARVATLRWTKLGSPGARTDVGSRQPYDTRFNSISGLPVPNNGFGFVQPGSTQVGTQTTNPAINDRWGFNANDVDKAELPRENEFATEATYHAPGVDIKYLGGYSYYNYHQQGELDGTPITSIPLPTSVTGLAPLTFNPSLSSDYQENRGWFSNELNFISTYEGPLQFTAGIYAYQENYKQPLYTFFDQAPAVGTGSNVPIDPVNGAPCLATGFAFVGGGLVADSRCTSGLSAANVLTVPQHPGSGEITFNQNSAVNNSYGAYVQTDYTFNSQFKLTTGLRYSANFVNQEEQGRLFCYLVVATCQLGAFVDETQVAWSGINPTPVKGVLNTTAANPSGAFTNAQGNRVRNFQGEWDSITGTVDLDWTPDRDSLGYIKYSRGYKPGGFGAAGLGTNFIGNPRFDNETLNAYEAGYKRQWRPWNLTTNAALFYYDYAGYQVPNTVVIPGQPANTVVVNLPKVQTLGFELETSWSPIKNLQLTGNYAYLDPEIQSTARLPLVDSIDPAALGVGATPVVPPALNPASTSAEFNTTGQNLKGNVTPYSPKNKAAINALYTWNFEDNSNLRASLSYYWEDISYSSIFNRWYTKVPSWDQWDGRLLWTDKTGHFTVIGYMKNIFDQLQYDNRGAGTRSPDTTPATNTLGPALCGSTPATSVSFATSPGGTLAQRCYTVTDTYRPPRTFGVELQFHY